MRINRTTIFISLIAASTLIITSALLVSDISDNVHPVTGDEFTYTLEFSETKNKPTFESDTGNTGSYTVYTDLGNPIQFDYSDVSEFTLGFLGMPAGASFSNPYLEDVANHNQISGIQTISIVSTGDLILYYGYGSEINEGIYFDSLAITSGETIDIDNASYFTLKNEGEVEIGITSISIVYSCFAVDKEMNLDALTFKLNSEETGYIVSDCYTSFSGEVIIPAMYNGLPVLEIGSSAFSYCTSLTSVVIPNSVTSISGHALYKCTSLTSIVIPSSVTSIGEQTFSFCTSLTSIYIPASVTSIDYNAFYNCTSLTIYCEASSKPSGWKYNWNSYRPVVWNYQGIHGVTEDGVKYGVTLDSSGGKCIVITGCVGEPTDILLSTINVGGEELPVKEICNYAFSSCTSLTSIYIPTSVTSIGYRAFENCTSLTTVVIPSSVTSIGEYAFYNCTSLTSVVIPSSVTSISGYAFYNCTSLTIYCEAASQPSGWSDYWNRSFRPVVWNYQGINEVTEDGVKYGITLDSDGNRCIAICGYVGEPTDVVFPSTISVGGEEVPVKEIISRAFEDCTSLTSIVIPNSATSIGEYAFSSCSSLTTVTIGENSQLQKIGDNAFINCSKLTSICIPSNITLIGERTFSSCSSLTTVTIGENSQLQKIGDRAFSYCSSLTSIYIPSSVISIGNYAFSSCSSLTTVTIGENSQLQKIGMYAFNNCSSLTTVIIDENFQLQTIGAYAFSGCSTLTSIYIPSSVTWIDSRAFINCSSLTIYCEASSKPNNWSVYWNLTGCTVEWGCTYEQYLRAIS